MKTIARAVWTFSVIGLGVLLGGCAGLQVHNRIGGDPMNVDSVGLKDGHVSEGIAYPAAGISEAGSPDFLVVGAKSSLDLANSQLTGLGIAAWVPLNSLLGALVPLAQSPSAPGWLKKAADTIGIEVAFNQQLVGGQAVDRQADVGLMVRLPFSMLAAKPEVPVQPPPVLPNDPPADVAPVQGE